MKIGLYGAGGFGREVFPLIGGYNRYLLADEKYAQADTLTIDQFMDAGGTHFNVAVGEEGLRTNGWDGFEPRLRELAERPTPYEIECKTFEGNGVATTLAPGRWRVRDGLQKETGWRWLQLVRQGAG